MEKLVSILLGKVVNYVLVIFLILRDATHAFLRRNDRQVAEAGQRPLLKPVDAVSEMIKEIGLQIEALQRSSRLAAENHLIAGTAFGSTFLTVSYIV